MLLPVMMCLAAPAGAVTVDIYEGVPLKANRPGRHPKRPADTSYRQPAFAFPAVPAKYLAGAARTARKTPILLRAAVDVELPAGEWEILVRARGDARLSIDEKQIGHVPKLKLSNNAHGRMSDASVVREKGIHRLWAGDNERLFRFEAAGGPHRVRLDMILGEKKRRPDAGESCVAVRRPGGVFVILGTDVPLTDAGWVPLADKLGRHVAGLEAAMRQASDAKEAAYWQRRHRIARKLTPANPAGASVDGFIEAKLKAAGAEPAVAINDWAFLRRVTVDLIGTVPSEAQIAGFFADKSEGRRARYIDRLLGHPGWAHNWVGYWQDVLAENPNLLKPTLNNTGPFRYWIYESFVDNKPFDRFATELIRMRGAAHAGGAGGFRMASQNDVPMAAKAHVVGQAFLGLEMKCARCHDAPFHDFEQKDLFAFGAMLQGKPLGVPKSSSVTTESDIIEVTLKPGAKVPPAWPFPQLASAELPAGVLRDAKDSREKLAALVTSPKNGRFAKVIANRLWRRFTGRGLVEPVDDWELAEPTHPELLTFLARELVRNGYDLKHVTRLIVNSRTYQREAHGGPADDEYLFAGPLRRRMTAEQIVDSLFAAAGKRLRAGELNFDLDGANKSGKFLNLGRPARAWQFASLSNERDRPSLSLPFAADFVSLLEAFGWRPARQSPRTVRDHAATVLQPAGLANGVVGGRVSRLSDDGALADLAVETQPLNVMIDRLVKRFLTRPPTDAERRAFKELLTPGYNSRAIDVDPVEVVRYAPRPVGVSWSTHFDPKANELKKRLEAIVRGGDAPSVRLRPDWRERAEDVIWALTNTPEFVFLP